MKQTKVLYAVTDPFFTGSLIPPRLLDVLGAKKKCFRIPLAETIEDAILFTYPALSNNLKKRLRLQVFELEVSKRHRIIKPSAMQSYYEFPYAKDLEEHGCFSNLRMTRLGLFEIDRKHKENSEVLIHEGESTKVVGMRFVAVPVT